MGHKEQLLKALEFFKDWSNYLLVTSVAALGWVVEHPEGISEGFQVPITWCIGLSVVFGILTLALIPIVGENVKDATVSIYSVKGPFKVLWLWGPEVSLPLKAVCLPQHALFIVGILLYVVGSTFQPIAE